VASEVALCPFWNALAALQWSLAPSIASSPGNAHPGYQDVLRQRCVWVFDLDESKLNAAV
jgi:hypothetical protein